MIADRFLLQQAWWILAELCRRHERMVLDRFTHAEHGGVLLAKRVGADAWAGVGVAANLVDGIRVMQQSGSTLIPWDAVFASGSAHDVVRRIERISPLGPVDGAPATTRRALAYRVGARLLTMRLDDRHDWTIEPWDAASVIEGDAPAASLHDVAGFESVVADLEQQRERFASATSIGPDHPTLVPYLWAVRRDVDTVLVLDTDGFAHTRSRGAVPIFDLYERHGRELDRVLHTVLEAVR